MLRSDDEVFGYLTEVATMLPNYAKTLPTREALELVVNSDSGRRVRVYAGRKPSSAHYDVFMASDEVEPIREIKPGERYPVNSVWQRSSGNAKEVADRVRRFLGPGV